MKIQTRINMAVLLINENPNRDQQDDVAD